MSRVSSYRSIAASSAAALLLTACNLPLQFLTNSTSGGTEVENPALAPTDASGALEGSGGEEGAPASGQDNISSFRCPDSPEAYELWFDHDVMFDTPGFGSWDILTNGTIILSVAEGLSEGTVNMPFQPGEVIVPGIVNASFGRGDQTCSFEGDMEVIVNIDGNCDQGVVHLNIVENWGDVDTSMTCCSSGQDCDTFPFQWMLPVVQYEDLQFTAANGYKVTKPFGGGEGQLSWQLAVPNPPAPIVE